MPTQTRTWQRRILDSARHEGYAGLFWFVGATAPGRGEFIAAFPGRHVPVVPVGPDPEISHHWAHLLVELFRDSEPRVQFATVLGAPEVFEMAGCSWHEWGALDDVCPACGAVNAGWACCEGSSAVRRM